MAIFTLTRHVNGDFDTVAAVRRGRQIVVTTPVSTSLTRNTSQATRLAAEALGPAFERAGKTSSEWGLHVAIGGYAALFGRFPERAASPHLTGPVAKPSEPIAHIFNEWKRHDGTPLGALNAALKIVEIYAERRPERAVA
jgi:hypothetical protein